MIKVSLKSKDLKFLEAFHRATLPDDANPPSNFSILHEIRDDKIVFSIIYEGPPLLEALRTAISTSEEILRLCKMLLEIIA